MVELKKTLVLGYGNPARGDDGLGPAFIETLEQAALADVETRVDYQLCVEDAMDIGDYREVVFIDASRSAEPPFEFYPLNESKKPETLDTHSISPEALIYLARVLFDAPTPALVLAIRGYQFEPFIEFLSPVAEQNLKVAFQYLCGYLSQRD